MAEESRTFKLTSLQDRQIRHESAGESWNGYVDTLLGKRAMVPQSAGVEAFETYIASTRAHRLVDDNSIMCLADALMYWLVRGDATSVCPSYEFYLQTVIHIIACWADSAGSSVYDFQHGEPGSICREPLDGWEHGDGDKYAYDDGRIFVVLPELIRRGSAAGIWNHPALSKDTFEYVRFRRQAGHADEFALD